MDLEDYGQNLIITKMEPGRKKKILNLESGEDSNQNVRRIINSSRNYIVCYFH